MEKEVEKNEIIERQTEVAAPEAPPEPLTADNIKARADAAREAAKKSEKSEEEAPPPKAAAPKTEKSVEKVAGDVSEEPKFTPNAKFTALGKEYELPKWAQGVVMDAASEKEVKEVFEKAMGLDHVKMRHQELQSKHTELQESEQATKSELDEIVQGVQELRSIYQQSVNSGNMLVMDEFFNKLRIPAEHILQYALEKAQYLELPHDQRQNVDQHVNAVRRARALETQNSGLNSQAERAIAQARAMQTDAVLGKADIAPLVQAYDSAPGRKPGDFRQEVYDYGAYTFMKTKGQTDLTPDQAVADVIKRFGIQAAPKEMAANPGIETKQSEAPKQPAPHRNVPVIPNISGNSGASPLKNKPRSIEDLRKLAAAQAG